MFSALDDGEVDKETGVLPELRKEELGHERFICAVNVRCLEGIDVGNLKVRRYEGREKTGTWTAD
jgi:hypothetical protein